MKLLKILLMFTLILVYACNNKNEHLTSSTPDESASVKPDSTKTLDVNDFHVQLSTRGIIFNGIWKNEGNPWVINLAGLWLVSDDNGKKEGNIVVTMAIPYSNFISKWNGRQAGVYHLSPGSNSNVDSWPVDLGAPVDLNGLPKIYGDAMCWTALTADTSMSSIQVFSAPIKNLRVTQAVYGYQKEDLRNVIFVKYGVTNTGTETMNNVSAGFYSDTDLTNALINRTGYDSLMAISYTYDTTANYVTGFSFLNTPKDAGIRSHRIMRKNNYINPEFGEYTFSGPSQMIYAVNGLSNEGKPMINPVTGSETMFAFTGNPSSRTGWLDTPVDVRSLLSTNSFSLAPGETTWINVVWVVTRQASLKASIQALKSQTEKIKSETSLWQAN